MAMHTSKTRRVLRLLAGLLLGAVVVVIGTLHAVGYREAWARVEDYVTAFRPDIPGAFEPYGSNTLLKTTQVRYNDAIYQVSFSSTGASAEEVIESYAKTLRGGKLVESVDGGKVLSLYHSDGLMLTGVRAMPSGPGDSSTIVQKIHSVKVGREQQPPISAEVAEVASMMSRLKASAASPEEARRQGMELLQGMADQAAANKEVQSRYTVPAQDRPGFDVPSVPRFPGSVRVSAMALEDGKVQIVRYLTDADAEMVMRFYRHALEAEGWQSDAVSDLASQQDSGAEQQHMVYSNGSASLNLIATPASRPGLTSVTAMVQ